MLKEFKEFAFKGSLIDLATGVVIGGATTAFIDSFVKNIVTPPVGLVAGANFDNLFMVLKEGKTPGPYPTIDAAANAGAVTLNFGLFLNSLISFLILMFVVFMIIRGVNRFKKAEEAAPAAPSSTDVLLAEIRDLLRK